MIKHRHSELIVVSLLLLIFQSCGLNKTKHNKLTLSFKVSSYNIRYNAAADIASGNGWEIRKGEVAKLIKKYNFDIVGTQEGDSTQMEELSLLLPGYYKVSHPYGGATGNIHTNSILYKKGLFEVLDCGVFWLSQTPDIASIGWDATDRRICQWTKFKDKKSGKEFVFFNAHFYWRKEEAKKQSGPLIIEKVKLIAGELPVILTGDFNSNVETSQIKAIKTLLKDSYDISSNGRKGVEGTNIAGGVFKGPSKGRIDFIFISEGIGVNDYEVYSDVYNTDHYPSDHLPVSVNVSF